MIVQTQATFFMTTSCINTHINIIYTITKLVTGNKCLILIFRPNSFDVCMMRISMLFKYRSESSCKKKKKNFISWQPLCCLIKNNIIGHRREWLRWRKSITKDIFLPFSEESDLWYRCNLKCKQYGQVERISPWVKSLIFLENKGVDVRKIYKVVIIWWYLM